MIWHWIQSPLWPQREDTAGNALEKVVAEFIQAKASNSSLPDILPKVLAIAKTLRDSGDEGGVFRKVAVAYTARGEFDRALALIQGFKEDYDIEDGAKEVAIQLAKLGQYDRALQLADKAGEYFGPIALVQIASEALKRGDKARALEILTRTDFPSNESCEKVRLRTLRHRS